MPSIVAIDKSGKIKDINWKDFQEAEIYKKAGLKNDKGFKCIRKDCWKLSLNDKSYNISIYGKEDGRSGQENQYDLPPPLDIPSSTVKLPFFGTLVLINYHTDGVTVQSLTKEEWITIYEKLFGGFEDLSENDSDESDEDMTGLNIDANGYEKDGFVVDSGDEDVMIEEEESEKDEKEEEEVPKKKKKKEISKKSTKEENIIVENFDYDDCDSELGEDDYMS
jgi:hypothetical protein